MLSKASAAYDKFTKIPINLMALQAQDTLQELAYGLQQIFGTAGDGPKQLPTVQAVQATTNAMAGMILTSLNDTLSTLLPEASNTSTARRKLQDAEDDFLQLPQLSGFQVITVASLDDYRCVGCARACADQGPGCKGAGAWRGPRVLTTRARSELAGTTTPTRTRRRTTTSTPGAATAD